jgi:hypothetical protein
VQIEVGQASKIGGAWKDGGNGQGPLLVLVLVLVLGAVWQVRGCRSCLAALPMAIPQSSTVVAVYMYVLLELQCP